SPAGAYTTCWTLNGPGRDGSASDSNRTLVISPHASVCSTVAGKPATSALTRAAIILFLNARACAESAGRNWIVNSSATAGVGPMATQTPRPIQEISCTTPVVVAIANVLKPAFVAA